MFTPVSQGNIVKDSSLYAFYDFGDPACYMPQFGTTVNDLSGNGNNATLIGGPVWNNTFGGCIQYDGIDDDIEYTGGFSSSFTVMLGIISTNADAPGTFWASDDGAFPCFLPGSNGLVYVIQNIANISAPISYLTQFDGNFYNLGDNLSSNEGADGYCTFANAFSVTTNGSNVHNGYMNNFQRFNNTNAYTTRSDSSVGTIHLGKDTQAGGRYPIGRLCAYMHYNRFLSADEIYQNHQYFNNKWLTKTGPQPGPY